MSITGYKEYEDLTEKQKEIVRTAEQTSEELTQEEIKIVNNLAKEGKIIDVTLIEKINFITQKKFKKVVEHLEFNFGKTISLEAGKDGSVTVLLDGKVLTKLNEEESKTVISNGVVGSKFVKVTGILKKTTWEVTDTVKNRIIAAILAGLIIIPIPLIFKECSNKKEPKPLPKPDEIIQELSEISIDISILENYFMKEFDDLSMILRMIEDQHEAYEYDLKVLDPNRKMDYEKINKEVEEAVQFLKEIEAVKAKYSSKSNLSGAELNAYIQESKQLLNKYFSILNLAKQYAQMHLESTNKRIEEQKQNEVNLTSESKITNGQIEYITSKMNSIEIILSSDLSQLFNLIQQRKIVVSEDSKKLMYFDDENNACTVYDGIENLLEDYELILQSEKGVGIK